MTTVAVRDRIMAVDTQWWASGRRYGFGRKLGRSKDGWWAAGTGEAAVINAFIEWMKNKRLDGLQRPWAGLPETSAWDHSGMILLAPDGRTFFYEGFAPVEMTAPFMADGSGAPVALGAMEAGATAIQALMIAGKHDPATGGNIEYVSAGFDGLGVLEMSYGGQEKAWRSRQV